MYLTVITRCPLIGSSHVLSTLSDGVCHFTSLGI